MARVTMRCVVLAMILLVTALQGLCDSELIERVVAVIGNDVILYSELKGALIHARARGEAPSEGEMLERLIDRRLILIEARKFRIGGKRYYTDTEEESAIIDEYIKNRIKVMIQISFDEIERYYNDHRERFKGREIYEVWNEIEDILRTEKTEEAIKEYIDSLKKRSLIRRQLY